MAITAITTSSSTSVKAPERRTSGPGTASGFMKSAVGCSRGPLPSRKEAGELASAGGPSRKLGDPPADTAEGKLENDRRPPGRGGLEAGRKSLKVAAREMTGKDSPGGQMGRGSRFEGAASLAAEGIEGIGRLRRRIPLGRSRISQAALHILAVHQQVEGAAVRPAGQRRQRQRPQARHGPEGKVMKAGKAHLTNRIHVCKPFALMASPDSADLHPRARGVQEEAPLPVPILGDRRFAPYPQGRRSSVPPLGHAVFPARRRSRSQAAEHWFGKESRHRWQRRHGERRRAIAASHPPTARLVGKQQ